MTVVTPTRVDAVSTVPVPTGVTYSLRFIGNRNYNVAVSGTQAVAIPSTVLAGDLALMFIAARAGRETRSAQEALGWTWLENQSTPGTSGEAAEGWVYYKIVSAAEASSLTMSYDGDIAGGTRLKRTAMVWFRGHDVPNQPLQAFKRTSVDGANPTVVEGLFSGCDRPGMAAVSMFGVNGSLGSLWSNGPATATNLRAAGGGTNVYLQYQFPDSNFPSPTIIDYFRSGIDSATWEKITAPDRPSKNGEVSVWDPLMVATSSDGLTITSTKTDLTHWPSGRIETRGRKSWQPPCILEARWRSPNIGSYWFSIWSMPDDEPPWAAGGEDDWFEVMGLGHVWFTLHESNPPNTGGAAAHIQQPIEVNFDESAYHVTKMVFLADRVIRYLDGVEVGRTTRWPNWPLPFNLHTYDVRIMTAIGSTNWSEVPLPNSSTPSGGQAKVDYVKVQPLPRVNSGNPQYDAAAEEYTIEVLVPSAFTQTATSPNPLTVQVRAVIAPPNPRAVTGAVIPSRVNVAATVPFLGVDNTFPPDTVVTKATVYTPTITHKLDAVLHPLGIDTAATVLTPRTTASGLVAPSRVDASASTPAATVTNPPTLTPAPVFVNPAVLDPLVNVGSEQITVEVPPVINVPVTVPDITALTSSPVVSPDAVSIKAVLLDAGILVDNPTGLFLTSFHRHHAQLEAKAHGHAWIDWRPL